MRECLERVSHREYLIWSAWFEEQWNKPDRSDYYAMRIAQRVQQVLAKEPGEITLDHQKVEFVRAKPPKPMSIEEATAIAQARWFGMLGVTRDQLDGNRS